MTTVDEAREALLSTWYDPAKPDEHRKRIDALIAAVRAAASAEGYRRGMVDAGFDPASGSVRAEERQHANSTWTTNSGGTGRAEGLDVERLATAMHGVTDAGHDLGCDDPIITAPLLAAEYARLEAADKP